MFPLTLPPRQPPIGAKRGENTTSPPTPCRGTEIPFTYPHHHPSLPFIPSSPPNTSTDLLLHHTNNNGSECDANSRVKSPLPHILSPYLGLGRTTPMPLPTPSLDTSPPSGGSLNNSNHQSIMELSQLANRVAEFSVSNSANTSSPPPIMNTPPRGLFGGLFHLPQLPGSPMFTNFPVLPTPIAGIVEESRQGEEETKQPRRAIVKSQLFTEKGGSPNEVKEDLDGVVETTTNTENDQIEPQNLLSQQRETNSYENSVDVPYNCTVPSIIITSTDATQTNPTEPIQNEPQQTEEEIGQRVSDTHESYNCNATAADDVISRGTVNSPNDSGLSMTSGNEIPSIVITPPNTTGPDSNVIYTAFGTPPPSHNSVPTNPPTLVHPYGNTPPSPFVFYNGVSNLPCMTPPPPTSHLGMLCNVPFPEAPPLHPQMAPPNHQPLAQFVYQTPPPFAEGENAGNVAYETTPPQVVYPSYVYRTPPTNDFCENGIPEVQPLNVPGEIVATPPQLAIPSNVYGTPPLNNTGENGISEVQPSNNFINGAHATVENGGNNDSGETRLVEATPPHMANNTTNLAFGTPPPHNQNGTLNCTPTITHLHNIPNIQINGESIHVNGHQTPVPSTPPTLCGTNQGFIGNSSETISGIPPSSQDIVPLQTLPTPRHFINGDSFGTLPGLAAGIHLIPSTPAPSSKENGHL